MKRLSVRFTIFAILLTASVARLQAQSSAGVSKSKTVKVKIYLLDNFESENLLENMRMAPVERTINKKSPLRSAIEAQLAGATEEENARAYYWPLSGIKLSSVQVKNKTAYALFTRTDGDEAFDKLAVLRFRKAITKTALQFSSVRKIEICLDGDLAPGLDKYLSRFCRQMPRDSKQEITK